ncbi:MAG: hypothetical protein JXD22_04645 [Sedimentisphaerales bacterium]|nr:hypothetical protein [Sedimentisphaerales bacterium]
MANGLRKLIKKAKKYSRNSTLTRQMRLNKFGPRFRVEELEERIAPDASNTASLTLTAGEYSSWDDIVGGGGDDDAFDATDGYLVLGASSVLGGGTVTNDIDEDNFETSDVTVAGAVTELYIDTNKSIGTLDLTGVTSSTLVLVVEVGATMNSTGVDAFTETVDGVALGATTAMNAGALGGNIAGANDPTALATASIGSILLPTSGTLAVEIHVISPTSITTISGGTGVSIVGDATNGADSLIQANALTTYNVGGPIDGLADGVTVDIVTTIGSWTSGELSASGAGGISIDADTSIGTMTVGGIDIDAAGGVTIDAGTTGFSGLLTLGVVDTATAASGLLSITTVGTGGFTGVAATSITNNSTAGGTQTIAQAGAGGMGGFTTTGNITLAGSSGITIGSATGLLGAFSTGTGDIANSGSANIAVNGLGIGGVTVDDVTITSTGSVGITAGATGFTGAVVVGDINASGGGGLAITATGTGGFLGITTGTVDIAGASGVQIQPTGTGGVVGDITMDDITVDITTTGSVTVGSLAGGTGALYLGDVTNNADDDTGDVTISSGQFTSVNITGSVITADAAATGGDILIQGQDGLGNVTVTGGNISAGADAGVTDTATITFDGDADNDGTGAIGNVLVTGGAGLSRIGNDADLDGSLITFTGASIGDIDATYIGLGGPVTFTTNDGTNTDGTIGQIGSNTALLSLGQGAAVTFTAHDGIAAGQALINVTGSIAAGGTVTMNANADAVDDTGAVPPITAGTTIGTTGANSLTINTNNGATDNTNATRTVGAITSNGGFARLNITSDGNVGMLTSQGDVGANGNDMELLINTAAADGNANNIPANAVDLAGINVVDTTLADSLTIYGASEISGRIWDSGNGQIIAGSNNTGADTDSIELNANLIIYNGDDTADGAIDVDYAAALPFMVDIVTGDVNNGGVNTIQAATQNATPFFQAVIDGETFSASTDGVGDTANITYQPEANDDEGDGDPDDLITLTDVTGLDATTELSIITSGASEFDCGGITLASGAANSNCEVISIQGDLFGDIGEPLAEFGNVEIIMISGDAEGGNANHTFYGAGLQGLGTGVENDQPTVFSTLLLGPNVTITALTRDLTEPVTLADTVLFQFADANAANTFNRHVITVGTGSEAVIYGIDGGLAGTYDYLGTGVSGETIDPAGVLSGNPVISRITLDGVTGLSMDTSIREIMGDMVGSFIENEADTGAIVLASNVSTISIGIDDNLDIVDNPVVTSIAGTFNTRADFDRLGGGEYGGAAQGLNPATTVTNIANLGNVVVWSMDNSADANDNINLVVTGNSGPVSLTGDSVADVPNHGNLVVSNSANGSNDGAAIAIGGNLEGAISIVGQILGGVDTSGDPVLVQTGSPDILVGIALDANNDGDWADGGEETPGGSVNANIIIGDATWTDILVATDINNDIVITGVDQDPELPGLELSGNLNGIKAGDEVGNDGGSDVIVIAGRLGVGTGYIIADGMTTSPALNSDIFVGGDGDDVLVIEGRGISSAAVLGGSAGIQSVDIIDHVIYGDTGDTDVLTLTGGAMTVQWVANSFENLTYTEGDVIGDVYVTGAATALTITTPTGDALDIGDVFLLDTGTFNLLSPGDVGVVVANDNVNPLLSDGVHRLTSENLLDLITTTYDVVFEPTALDTAMGDDASGINFAGDIAALNAGGVMGCCNVDLGASVPHAFGYIVALTGYIDAQVHAGEEIGHIVASEDIDGTFQSEGSLAIDTTFSNIAQMRQDMLDWGLTGVPEWFLNSEGGILSEAGDIGANGNNNAALWTGTIWYVNAVGNEAVFTAAGEATNMGNSGSYGWSAPTMGTFYVPAGNMSADIEVGGDFGGIQVPAGNVWVEVTVPIEAEIARIIAPQYTENGGNASSSRPVAEIEAISGETLVFNNGAAGVSTYTIGNYSVAVTGTGMLGIVADDPATAWIDSILMVDGVQTGATLNIVGTVLDLDLRGDLDGTANVEGDLVTMTVAGDWTGDLNVLGSALNDTLGEAFELIVEGTITGSADLAAYNFYSLEAGDDSAVTTEGTLNGRSSYSFTNLAGDDQTLFLQGSRAISADYTLVFNKLTEVELIGRGKASVASLNADLDATVRTELRELLSATRNARAGRGDDNLYAEGTAHLGELTTAGAWLNLGDVVVNGVADVIDTPMKVNSLWISDDAGTVNIGQTISRAFIGGDVEEFAVRMGRNVFIGGDVDEVSAWRLTNTRVMGTTDHLNIAGNRAEQGAVINSFFAETLNHNFVYNPLSSDFNPVRVVRSTLNYVD